MVTTRDLVDWSGGAAQVAQALGVDNQTVYCWYHRQDGVPRKYIDPWIKWARTRRVHLTLEDFFRSEATPQNKRLGRAKFRRPAPRPTEDVAD